VVPNAFLPLTSYDVSGGLDASIVGVDERVVSVVGMVNVIALWDGHRWLNPFRRFIITRDIIDIIIITRETVDMNGIIGIDIYGSRFNLKFNT
jgi:hypothetical protein